MPRYATQFAISTGMVVQTIKDGLAASGQSYATGVTVQPKRPAAMPTRLVTIRNDGGPDNGILSRRRTGINVWAEDSTHAENLAHLVTAILRKATPSGTVVNVTGFSAPYEVEDDPDLTDVTGQVLAHCYFTCTVTVRATDF